MDTLNADYIDSQYRRWKANPDSVPIDWQFFFRGFELAGSRPDSLETLTNDVDHGKRQAAVESLIRRYRDVGHLLACMDPLSACPTEHPLLNLEAFDLSHQDLEKRFFSGRLFESESAILKDILALLRETYCRSIGVEYMHLQDPA